MNPIRYSDLITPEGNDTIQQAIDELTNLINTFNQAKQTIQASASQTAQSMQGLSGATSEQRDQIAQLSSKVAELETELKNLQEMQKSAVKTRKQLTQAQKDEIQLSKIAKDQAQAEKGSYNALSAEYRECMIKLRQMGDAKKAVGGEFDRLKKRATELRGEMSKFNKDLGDYRMEVGHYQNALSALPGTLGRIGRAFTSWQALSVAAIGAVIAGITKLVKMMKDWVMVNASFEQANANLQSVLGASKKDMEALTDTALSLGRSTEWTASQVTSLQMELAKLGFGDASIIAMQKHVLAFATAVGADLGEAANMAGAAIRAFNLTSADSERVMGTLAVAVNNSALTFDRIKYAMGTVFPIAHAFGLEIEDATALLGALANAGFSAESAATATRNMLLNLADANGKLAQRTGGAAKSFEDIIMKAKQLREEGANLSEIFELTDKRSVAAFNALIDGADVAVALRDRLNDVEGELRRIQQTRLDTITGQTTILKSYWEGFKLSIRESNGFLKQTIIFMQEAVKWANKLFFPEQIAKQTALDQYMTEYEDFVSELRELGEDNDIAGALEITYNAQRDEMQKQVNDFNTQISNLGKKYTAEEKKRLKEQGILVVELTQEEIAAMKMQLENERDAVIATMEGMEEAHNLIQQRIILDEQERLAQEAQTRAEAAEEEDAETKKQKQQRLKDLQAKVDEAKYEVSIAEKGTEQIYRARVKLAEAERDLDMEKNRQAEATAKRDEKIINDKWDKELNVAKETTDKEATQINLKRLQNEQQLIQNEIAITKDGTEEMLALRIANLDKQEEIEKEQLKNREDYYKMSEEQIQQALDSITEKYKTKRMQEDAKFWVTMANRELKARQDIAEAVFRQEAHTEREKSMFKLEQEKFRLEAILETNKTAAEKMTDLEVEAVTETIKAIESEMERLPYDNIYDLIGLKMTDEQRNALDTVWGAVKGQLQSLIDSYKEAADAAVESANRQVEAAQRIVDGEMEARQQGFASREDAARKELELAKRNQEKALKEQEKVKNAQLAIDSITQASSLTTASANIWAAFSKTPWGMALAIASISAMWVSFLAAKAKAREVSQKQFGEGTVELLEGGSHASGNDIDLGYDKKKRRYRRAEGGEYFAIINKRNSRRYHNVIPDVIKSFNDGTFAEKYVRANETMAGMATQIIGGGTDISRLEKDVRAIKEQGNEKRFVDNDGRLVVQYKNLTRRIK